MEVIVGTAGHIDHGKTALVKALTGVDADRLPEEKKRGITIDIGFAEMSVGDAHFGFVDVPGHERFVKNMLAGASGIDLVLLVVAADEGVMPQTREHFDICRLLGVERGLIALTKSDLVDDEALDLAKLDVTELVEGSFLENAPIVAVSSKTGSGLDQLREALVAEASAAASATDRRGSHVVRLPIDRSFSMKGFGAVVTGTLASGEIAEGDELVLLPDGKKVRVRGIQSHGKKADRVAAGRRVAVNLGGVDHSEVVRGMTLTAANILEPAAAIDAEVEVLPSAPRPLRSRQRVRVHIGTVEALARVHVLNDAGDISQGRTDLVQLRFESPVVAVPDERFIIRSYSPQVTVAGGGVIDNAPQRHRRKELSAVRAFLNAVSATVADAPARVRVLVENGGSSGITVDALQSRTGLKRNVVDNAVAKNIEQRTVIDLGGRLVAAASFDEMTSALAAEITAFHRKEPLARGMQRELLRDRVFAFVPAEIVDGILADAAAKGTIILDKETVRLALHSAELAPEETSVSNKIAAAYANAGLEVAKVDDVLAGAIKDTKLTTGDARKFLQRFLDSGEIVKVTVEFYFSRAAIDQLKTKLKAFAETTADRSIDVPQFKTIAGVSRKYAIPLLEYFDREHITARVGDSRKVL